MMNKVEMKEYYHSYGTNNAYISEYILSGNVNANADATSLGLGTTYIPRDWSIYKNETQYANKARLHSEYLPIYGYDLQEKGNSKLESELGLKGVPALLRIENGSVKNTYTNWADINNTLIDELEK